MVREEYKQTEVGVIPEDWTVVSIGEIANISVGKDVNEAHFSTEQDAKYKYPVYSNTVDNKGLYGYYDYAEFNGKSLTVVGRGVGLGTAFSRIGSYGAIGRLVVVFPKMQCDNRFLTNYINHEVDVFSESSGIPQLTGIGLAKYKVALPPLPEQKAIAQALSDADDAIAELDRLITKKHNIKQGTMQQLLTGKKRLPGFSGEWEVKRLGEYVYIMSGESPSKFNFVNTGIPYFKVEQLNNSRKYQVTSPYYITCNNPVPKGSLIFPKRGASILLNKIRILIHGSFMDTNLMTLTTNSGLDNEFLFYVLSYQELWRIADTTSIPQINNKHINPFLIPYPSLPEQQAIAQVLTDMDAEIETLEQKRDKYKVIKQGMMQELLTGRTRLI